VHKRQIFVEGIGRSAFSPKIAAVGEEKSNGLHVYGKDFFFGSDKNKWRQRTSQPIAASIFSTIIKNLTKNIV